MSIIDNSGTDVRRKSPEPFKLETRAAEGKSPVLVGYAAVFDTLSEESIFGEREKIAPGAFAESIESDDIRALIEHVGGLTVIGRNRSGSLRLREDDHGLLVEIDIPDTTAGKDIVTLVERKDLTDMSFGFVALDDDWQIIDGVDVRTLRRVQLLDVSIVAFPAYPHTNIEARSNAPYGEMRASHEKWKQAEQQVIDDAASLRRRTLDRYSVGP